MLILLGPVVIRILREPWSTDTDCVSGPLRRVKWLLETWQLDGVETPPFGC